MHLLLRTLVAIVVAGAIAVLAARRVSLRGEADAHRQAEMDDWATAGVASERRLSRHES
ncbi:hypothetical protein GCM10009532_15820 [Microbacterium aurantiacum]